MQNRRGFIALIVTIFIWGSTFIVTKLLLEEVGPLQLTLLRFAIAFAALAPFAARQGFKLKDIFNPTFLLFGLTGTTLYYALQNLGMSFTSVSSTSLILSIVPVVTAVFAVIFLNVSPDCASWASGWLRLAWYSWPSAAAAVRKGQIRCWATCSFLAVHSPGLPIRSRDANWSATTRLW
jgi:drug/metabolite transporter (DMT)-like permease